MLVGLFVVAWCDVLIQGSPPLNSANEPIGGDYIAFHTAGRLLLSGRGSELYDPTSVSEVEASLLGGRLPGFYDGFRNPPFAAVPFVPLAALDLLPGLVVWTLASLACLAVSLRLLLEELPWLKQRWRGALLLVFAFAPVYFGLIDGENAMVSLLLYVLIYRAIARDQAGLAGVWAALGLFKPQLFLVFPLVFLARRSWRALLGYGLTALALGVISLALVGPAGVQAWARILVEPEANNATATAWRMASLRSFFDLLLPGLRFVSLGLYGASSVLLLAVLLRAWARQAGPPPVLWALTSLVAVLVDPHLVDYDLSVLVPAGLLAVALLPPLRWWIVLLYGLAIVRAQIPLGGLSLQLTVPVLAWCAWLVLRALREGSTDSGLPRLVPARAPDMAAGLTI